jgi:beta-lactamase regulating signal transducer with metallopeptidase domain/tetratricopeptide (TPR) repeat protein
MTAHLVAATVTALIAIAAAFLLRRRSAALRHGILFAAVLAFAIPTPWLNTAGDKIAGCVGVNPRTPSFLSFGFPFRTSLPALPASHPTNTLTPRAESHNVRNALYLLWTVVFSLSIATWLRRMLQRVPTIRTANPLEHDAMRLAKASIGLHRAVDLCITSADRVPGARGWYRPCVVLPDLLSEQLSEAELQAVMAHELAHVARRDNLFAAMVRVVVSVFWFHPLLWWIERRMLAEREAACDEMVLTHGADPADYVSAILKVCRMSFAGVSGYAGATGSNLNHRMEQIMFAHAVRPSSRLLRAIPGAVLVLALALPTGVGLLQSQTPPPAKAVTHPANDEAIRKAFGCLQKGEFQEAEQLFRQVYLLDPEDSRGPVGLAESYMSEARTDDAIQLMQTEIARHPDRTDSRMFLGNLYVRTEQFDQAIAESQSALAVGNNLSAQTNADLLFRLGEANRLKGDLNEAMRLFKASAALDPRNAHALLLLAMILQGTGRDDEAVPAYEEVLKIQPDNAVALNNLAYLIAEHGIDLDRALTLAQQAIKGTKRSPAGSHGVEATPAEFCDTLGWILIKKNRPDDAIAAFRNALRSEPDNPTFHFHLGMAFQQMGNRTAAIQEYKTASANHPPPDVEASIRELLAAIAP